MPAADPIPTPGGFYARFGKRALDLGVASLALLALLPLLAVAALLVRASSPGPIFFRQDRLGRDGRIFRILKFRTMTDRPRGHHHEVLPGNPEVTRVGAVLRRTKIDELPQLLHVLAGQMSLVGPRPDLPAHLPGYTPLARARLLVRPGLTGLAQIHGNIYLTWEQRWHYDADYVRRLGFGLDLHIILSTFRVLAGDEKRYLRPPPVDSPEASEAPKSVPGRNQPPEPN